MKGLKSMTCYNIGVLSCIHLTNDSLNSSSLSSVQFSRSVVPDSLRPHESQHARPPCPSLTPGAHQNPCPLSRWCHPTISSSVVPFSSCPQSFPASGSFQMSQLFASGGQSIGISALTSALPMNTQDCSPLGWTIWISFQSKRLSSVLFFLTSILFIILCKVESSTWNISMCLKIYKENLFSKTLLPKIEKKANISIHFPESRKDFVAHQSIYH